MSDRRGGGVVDVALRNHRGPSDDLTVKKIVNVTVNKSDTARRRVFSVPPQMSGVPEKYCKMQKGETGELCPRRRDEIERRGVNFC